MDRRSRAPWAHRQELRAAHTDSRAARPGPHPPPATARTHRARFAGERHEAFGVAVVATEAREAPGPDATAQELAELIGNSSGLSGRAGCHNVQSRTLVCKPQMKMSGFSKVEMSALPPGGRDRGDGDVDHGGTGALGGADAACRAAPDTTAGRRTAGAECTPGPAARSALCRRRRRGTRVAP